MGQTVFTNVKILDGSGAQPFEAEVLVQGNRIKSIARDGASVAREGADVVDGGGATLMPGLVEAHAHPSFVNTATLEGLGDIPTEEHTLQTMKCVRQMLDQGFTSICSAAAAKPRLDVVMRNAINAGDIPGPRMLAASPELTVTSGLGDVSLRHMHRETFALVCDGADEFRKCAREMVREQVDTIKINPSGDEFIPFAKAHHTVMTEAEVEAVCEVAHSRGIRMASHARSAESVKMSLRHGVQVIYHATLVDEEALDQLEAVKDTVFVAPGIGIQITTLYEAGDWGITTEFAESIGMRRELEIGSENMKALKQRGVRVLPGGDYGFAWNPIGTNARDLEHFVEYLDYTPAEAIEAATRLGGELMMMGDELGMVREGYLADLILVDGDPLQDISILQDADRLLAIMKDGQFHKAPGPRAAGQQAAA